MSSKGGPLPVGLPPRPTGSPPPRPSLSLRDRIGDRLPSPGPPPSRSRRQSPHYPPSPPRPRYRDLSPRREFRDRDDGYRYRSPPEAFYRPRERTPDWDRRDREPTYGRSREPERGRYDARDRDRSPPRHDSYSYRDRSPHDRSRGYPPPRGPSSRFNRGVDGYDRRSRSPYRPPLRQNSPRRPASPPLRRRSRSPPDYRRSFEPRGRNVRRDASRSPETARSKPMRYGSRSRSRSRQPYRASDLSPRRPAPEPSKSQPASSISMDIDEKKPSIQPAATQDRADQTKADTAPHPVQVKQEILPPTGPRAFQNRNRYPHPPTQPRMERLYDPPTLPSSDIKMAVKESPRSPDPNVLRTPPIGYEPSRSPSPRPISKTSTSPPPKASPFSPHQTKPSLPVIPSTAVQRVPPQEPRSSRLAKQQATAGSMNERKPLTVIEALEAEVARLHSTNKSLQLAHKDILSEVRRATFDLELAKTDVSFAERRREMAVEYENRITNGLPLEDFAAAQVPSNSSVPA